MNSRLAECPTTRSKKLEQQRLAELEEGHVGWNAHDVRHRQPEKQRGDSYQEPGNRSGDADVEQHPLRKESAHGCE